MIKHEITGIILAGGKSRRMGTEKGLIEFDGKPLIQYAIEALEPLCDTILISTNGHSYDLFSYQKVADKFPNSGPMGGIYSCLKISKSDKNIVLSCDMPFIKTRLISDLIQTADDYDLIIPWHGGHKFEPMCALYNKSVEPVFLSFIQQSNFKIPDTFEHLKTHKFRIDQSLSYYSKELFFNVNSKEDLDFVQKGINPNHV